MFTYLPLVAIIAIGLLIAARVISLARRGVRAIVVRKQPSLAAQAFEAAAFALLVFWVYLLAAYADGRGPGWLPAWLNEQLFDATALKLLGAAMLVAGVATFALAIHAMGASFRMGIEEESSGGQPGRSSAPLVTDGVFARSRNPIYLAFDLVALGSVLVHGRVIVVLAAAALAAAFHVQILREERFLAAMHGEAFAEYRRRVRRYV
ncbi:MAG TPA: methyltransferase [Lacipirellula sp.]